MKCEEVWALGVGFRFYPKTKPYVTLAWKTQACLFCKVVTLGNHIKTH